MLTELGSTIDRELSPILGLGHLNRLPPGVDGRGYNKSCWRHLGWTGADGHRTGNILLLC